MENASKALIIAASTLIAVMLMTFMAYMFRRFGMTADITEQRMSEKEIEAYNARYVTYDTGGNHNIDDEISVTYARSSLAGSIDTKYITYKNLFHNAPPSIANPDSPTSTELKNLAIYKKELIATSQTLNRVSDVVTCINDAIDTNYQNNNGYRYSTGVTLEFQNSVEIIVDLRDNGTAAGSLNTFNFSKQKSSPTVHYQYLVIEPNPDVKAKRIYGLSSSHTLTTTGTNTENKKANVSNFSSIFINDDTTNNNAINVYDMLEELRATKIIESENKTYTVYKYYFIGEVFINDVTGLVETVKFTLVKDKNF